MSQVLVANPNYAASLRLEGFNTSPNDGYRRLSTREAALKAIRVETAITAGSRG
ncbi:YhfG family protein [Azotobacter vinelandii]|uniref:YhfG family protein n=1 Tax=Azotobacter vinelandii TaxID=354 RepID=UPI001114EB5C|nr:YhfG family protein [Azotobacter vinelandii]WKN24440.1 YhfG family protein [Azotobacter vinelandii]